MSLIQDKHLNAGICTSNLMLVIILQKELPENMTLNDIALSLFWRFSSCNRVLSCDYSVKLNVAEDAECGKHIVNVLGQVAPSVTVGARECKATLV